MAGRDIIVVGASAGGIEALCQVVAALPPGLPAAVFVVCHFPASVPSALPDILSRKGPLLARHARDGEPIYPAHIYVAPPDYHLLLQAGGSSSTRLQHGPRENGCRPAIEPLFRSAARVFGSRVIAVLLSGGSHDGIAGLMAVRAAGGLAVLQDPRDALVPILPRNAETIAGADHVAPARDLGPLLARLVQEGTANSGRAQTRGSLRRRVSIFTCPECGGCTWQIDEEGPIRFRCHVGHTYVAETLLAERSAGLEAALWTAVRTFREKSVLAQQLANRDRAAGNADTADRLVDEARLAERYGELIHQYLLRGPQEEKVEAAG